MRPSRSCNLLFIAASSTPGAGMLARRARARAVAPGSLLPAPGWQLTLCPPPRRTRPGEVAPRPRLTRPLALSPCPHPQRPASLLRRRRLTPSERSPPNVTNEPSKRSSGGLATGAAHPPPPRAPQMELAARSHSSKITTTRCFCLLTPTTQTLCAVSGDSYPLWAKGRGGLKQPLCDQGQRSGCGGEN